MGPYILGLRFLYSLRSARLGGAGRDADRVVDDIAACGLGVPVDGRAADTERSAA